MGFQLLGHRGIVIDEHCCCGAARKGFEPQGAATREQVETVDVGDMTLQPVEQGLAYPVGGGAQALRIGKIQFAPAPLATDDA